MSAVFWSGVLLFIVTGCGLAFVVWQSFRRGDKNTKR
jgi:uncharacterized membrane protein